MIKKILPFLKFSISLLLLFSLGFLGLTFVFSDYGANESSSTRLLLVFYSYSILGVSFGLINPKKWIWSILGAWAFLFATPIGIYHSLQDGFELSIISLIIPLPVLIISAFLGSSITTQLLSK